PSLATHPPSGGGDDKLAYVAMRTFVGSGCNVMLIRFSDFGASLDFGGILAESTACAGLPALASRVLKGPQVAAGPGKQVLACWLDTGADGDSTVAQPIPQVPPTPLLPLNKFTVARRSSNALAASFAGDVTPAGWIYAARDVASELPYYLGPDANYFNISSSFPSLAIDHLGNAHLVFSYAPSPSGRFAADAANV